MRTYPLLPRLPDAGLLTRYLETLGVIVPLARTNLITNPSFETGTTGWSTGADTTITQVGTVQYHGTKSLNVSHPLGLGGRAIYAISLTSGAWYVYSLKFISNAGPGILYKISIANNVGVDQAAVSFRSTGRWQWVWVVHQATATASHQLNIERVFEDVLVSSFNIDGAQLEQISDGYYVPTTYIDGDQKGLVPNQFPPAYGWNGTPHASTSYRIGQTRAGGRIVRLKDLGFLVTAILGLGLAPPLHHALTFAQLDGGQYQDTIKPPRQFSLAGRVAATTPNNADAGLSQLSRLLDRDLVAQRQPLILTTYAQDCGVQCGERVDITALYSGGLEGQVQETPTQQIPITFTQYLPYVQGRDQGSGLVPQESIASPNGILRKPPGGEWETMSTGVSGGDVRAIVVGLDGLIYVGGAFTNAGGTGADFIASYNPQTDTWAVLGSATALNAAVEALAVGPDGRIYVGGSFTNASGIAAADFIAVWNPATAAWAALSTGMNAVVSALAFSGPLLYAGGNFTTAGGGAAARVAVWDGSAWAALGTGANAQVFALAAIPGGGVYIGGLFTNGGGVAAADAIGGWDGAAWFALSSGMDAQVNALAVGPNGLLYAGGVFTTAGGVTAGGVAVWNGVGWQQLGSGFSSPGTDTPNSFAVRPDGSLLIASTGAVVDPGTPNAVFAWNGSAYVSAGIRITTPGDEGTAVAVAPDGTLYAGLTGTVVSTAVTPITNDGTVGAYPVIVINGPTSGTARIVELTNETTGQAIYFNLTLSAGEIATLTLDPTNITFVSTFQGNILNMILPGSNLTSFVIQPGVNDISFFAASSTVAATIGWEIGYTSLNDALYQAVAP
jgi:hypothetical protein